VLLLFVVGYVVGQRVFASQSAPAPIPSAPGAGRVDPPYEVADFTLTSQTGDPLSLSSLRGRPVLMFFGYTHCPDVCPATLATYKRVKAALAERGDDVAFVLISVDGTRDTPAVMADYLQRVDSSFIGLTGPQTELERIGATYGLITNRVAPEAPDHSHDDEGHEEDVDSDHYFVEHTSPSFLIDAQGYLRMVYFYGASVDAMVAGLDSLL
jgi:protein SCO1/2